MPALIDLAAMRMGAYSKMWVFMPKSIWRHMRMAAADDGRGCACVFMPKFVHGLGRGVDAPSRPRRPSPRRKKFYAARAPCAFW